MTISPDMTKAELIVAVRRELIREKRVEEAALFDQLAAHARDVQEVMAIVPDDLPIKVQP